MIFDSTYIDKKRKEELERQIGKPFGLLKGIKKGGIGSHRMIIDRSSKGFDQILDKSTGIVYGSIEMRPKGVLLHFNVKNTRYSWSIPFFRLVFYNTEYFGIHAAGEYLSFRKDKSFEKNKAFVNKLMDTRVHMSETHESPNP